MWTALKKFFSKDKAPPAPQRDLAALTMLQQLIRAHLKGRVLYPDGGIDDQARKIVNRAQFLGIDGDNVVTVDKEIKKILADDALGTTRY